ncbi:MAG: response regulator transcription factor [Planctomycetes bacterium]|nr:response regulator transcription factor [Planctomycetota bacterium]
MLTALLVDDEPRANDRMQKLLAAHLEIEVSGVAGSIAEARAFLETTPPDVLFLDVEMPGGSGLDLLVSVADATQVVFVTAREKYAVQAFAAAALDYLVKPVDPDRLADTIARIHRQAARSLALRQGDHEPDADVPDGEVAPVGLDDALSLPLAGKNTSSLVTVSDICWIESLRNYTRVSLKAPAGVLLFNRRMSHWDKILPTGLFARVSRSYIVQVAAVEQIEWSSRKETTATFGAGTEPLILGRLPATRLRDLLGGKG